MGLFDVIVVEHELPYSAAGWYATDIVFQTKSLERAGNVYRLTKGGTLLEAKDATCFVYEDESTEAKRDAFSEQTSWRVLDEFDGDVIFYNGFSRGIGPPQAAGMWLEYRAHYTAGNLRSIEPEENRIHPLDESCPSF